MPSCIVCGNPIRANPVGIGHGLYRHRSKCAPLSKAYCRRFPRSESARIQRALKARATHGG